MYATEGGFGFPFALPLDFFPQSEIPNHFAVRFISFAHDGLSSIRSFDRLLVTALACVRLTAAAEFRYPGGG